MNQHPPNLTIEIDRDRLRRYLRVKWLLAWTAFLSFFGVLIGFASISDALDRGFASRAEAAVIVAQHIGTAFGISLLVALSCYLVLSHWMAGRLAESLELSVEGAFLRIRQHMAVSSDRKLHFRSIVDYAVIQDFLMRQFEIHALHMATTAAGQNTILIIPGVKDCLRVRDLLAEIDSQRELE